MILRTQHCTNKKCPYALPHTAAFCGMKQTRKCKCPFDKAARKAAKAVQRHE